MKPGAWGPLTLSLLILLGALAWWIANSSDAASLRMQWLCIVAVLLALCVLAGYLVNSRIDGILIDDRNRVSLERLQWTAWLVVLFSGYFAEAIWNVGHGGGFPDMQTELYALLGIVSASPVVSNLIVDTKKQNTAGAKSKDEAQQPLAKGDKPARIGAMDANKTVAEASWADLYLGEEVANRYVVDISRLQKLVITVLLVVTYFGWLWRGFEKPPASGFVAMPPVGETFVWLLGISHASYLALKATPKTPS